MAAQIYLMLLRQSGNWKTFDKTYKNVLMGVPLLLKQITKDMVMGDSLDIPFVKFIRCDSVSHGISFSGLDKKVTKTAVEDPTTHTTTITTDEEELDTGNKFRKWGGYKAENRVIKESSMFGIGADSGHDYGFLEGAGSWSGGNEFIKNKVPSHGEVVFSKSIDTATPELAYGCAAQEQYPFAVFFYRRKSGLGVAGVRWPYFVMGLYKCKIKDWSLSGDSETAKLHYKTISWCGYDQWADTNISYPWSTRWFDQEKSKGGQGGFAALLQGLAAGLVMGAAGLTAAATGG